MRRTHRPLRGQARSYRCCVEPTHRVHPVTVAAQKRSRDKPRACILRQDANLAHGAAQSVGARLPAKASAWTTEMRRAHRPLRGQARYYRFCVVTTYRVHPVTVAAQKRSRDKPRARILRQDTHPAYGAAQSVGARLPAKASAWTTEMRRKYRPLRGQARSYRCCVEPCVSGFTITVQVIPAARTTPSGT